MRRFRTLAAVAALALTAAAARVALADAIAVPVGVKIPCILTQQLESGMVHVGDPFTFKTTKDVKLGDVDVPADTPGTGRVAIAQPAQGKQPGSLALQADAIDLPDGRTISVNIDTTQTIHGHLAKNHTVPLILPGLVIGGYRTQTGDMVLDNGTSFGVVTVLPRTLPAPLLTAPPTPEPTGPPEPPPAPAGSHSPAT